MATTRSSRKSATKSPTRKAPAARRGRRTAPPAPHHIGIVEAGSDAAGAGTFDAIEGNTAVGDDCDGGMVMRRRRYMTQVAGFGRIRSQGGGPPAVRPGPLTR